MATPTTYNDADRVRLAVQRGTIMLGPPELGHCNHGRLYSYRWTWPIGDGPEDGEPEFISQKCQKCNPEDSR